MKYDEKLNAIILSNCDEKYAKFHGRLVPNTIIKGVRTPTLRQIAKEFSQYDDFLKNITLDSYETICVACYYIGLTTKDIATLKDRVDFILPYIDNWATCDTFVASLKILKKDKGAFYNTLLNYLESENNFSVRFAVVCSMTYYIDENNINELLKCLVKKQNRSYYIDMAIAWFISIAFIKCREQTLEFLKSDNLTQKVQNIAISKICDSFRVSPQDKQLVKTLKK